MELERAQQQNDWHQVWVLSRLIGGTRLGPKKRRFQLAATFPPTVDEWIQHMGQEGPSGGMQARAISIGSHEEAPCVLEQAMAIPPDTAERTEYIAQRADQLQLRLRPAGAAAGISGSVVFGGVFSTNLSETRTDASETTHRVAEQALVQYDTQNMDVDGRPFYVRAQEDYHGILHRLRKAKARRATLVSTSRGLASCSGEAEAL
eukprot:5415291-Pyramimonas_sp.AAC.3